MGSRRQTTAERGIQRRRKKRGMRQPFSFLFFFVVVVGGGRARNEERGSWAQKGAPNHPPARPQAPIINSPLFSPKPLSVYLLLLFRPRGKREDPQGFPPPPLVPFNSVTASPTMGGGFCIFLFFFPFPPMLKIREESSLLPREGELRVLASARSSIELLPLPLLPHLFVTASSPGGALASNSISGLWFAGVSSVFSILSSLGKAARNS